MSIRTAASPLLLTILAGLAAAGCRTEEATMCLSVAADAESCPAAESVDEDSLYSLSECDLEAREVLGEGELSGNPWGDTGGEGICCYPVQAVDTDPRSTCAVGRPYLEAEGATVAPTCAGTGWGGVAGMGAAATPLLRDAWLRQAAMEHASIAAFARLSLDLMALGAPADLLADLMQAAADEVDHAQRCYRQASRAAGQPLQPGPFPFAGPVQPCTDLADLAAAAVREGCLGETVGAALAAKAAAVATDPGARIDLQKIAEDEARHAALSWRIVAWALQQGGAEVRAAVVGAFRQPLLGGAQVDQDSPALRAHGLLGPDAHAQAARRAWMQVVAPAAAVLLAA